METLEKVETAITPKAPLQQQHSNRWFRHAEHKTLTVIDELFHVGEIQDEIQSTLLKLR